MSASVALVTCAALPDLDPDDRPLLEALAGRGISTSAAVWDDGVVAWQQFDLAVLRSTWDYTPRRDEFVAWARRVESATKLANPAEVVAWNSDKRYLADLDAAGVPVVPTTFLEPGAGGQRRRSSSSMPVVSGQATDDAVVAQMPVPTGTAGPGRMIRSALETVARGNDGGDLVVKPAVSAGSKDTARYGAADLDAAVAHAAALLDRGRTVMLQPYLDAVDTDGETALLFLGGSYSHAVRKGPLLRAGAGLVAGLYAEEEISARTPTGRQRAVAAQALAAVPGGPGRLLYARVDLLDDPGRGPVVLEVELVEPSLFMATASGAVERLADAVAALL